MYLCVCVCVRVCVCVCVCAQLGVPATEILFLDDLGVNCKAAAAQGWVCIKVSHIRPALEEMWARVGRARL